MKKIQFKIAKAGAAILSSLLLTGLSVSNLHAQSKYQTAGGVSIVIEGTSNIHDWDMKSSKGSSSGTFTVGSDGTLNDVSGLSFSMPAESLKSEHSAMDNNTYKALNTNKYQSISFSAASASVKHNGGSSYLLSIPGKLTISGVTKDVQLLANCVVNGDKSISCTGSYKLKMTDYKVNPPSIMFGAIKTGNDITVKFNLVLRSI